MTPVQIGAEGNAIAVSFGESGRQQVVTRIDPASLDIFTREQEGRAEPPSAPTTGATRAVLDDGRSIVCWAQENAAGGRQVMAQMWAADGSKIGTPVVISPPDADVFGAPRAVTMDGRHVVVAFASTTGRSFDLRAVSLEDAERPMDSDPMARR
jgi:hypothetical protein